MSSESSSGSSDEEEVATLASTREKRCNAGARMSRMLEAEEEDDFYKTTYGGFDEEAEDNDYASEDSVADDVDSDFDIDENDELKSDGEDDEVKRKRQGVHTKAYKEPKKPKSEEPKKTPKEKKPKPKPKSKAAASTVQIYHSPLPKSVRRSTLQKSAETVALQEERAVKAKMMKQMAAKKNVSEVRRLTQAELLAEAKITEEINLKALETYQRMELEKKKARGQKQIFRGPLVKYLSTTMPLIEELESPQDSCGGSEPEINVDEEDNVQVPLNDGDLAAKRSKLKPSEKCSRTFITFTDEVNFKEIFSKKKCKPSVKQYCPVTRSPAKYFDPVTQLPYANSQAFSIIREAYAQYMESASASAKRSKPNPPTPTSTVSV
ncbi:hypothetical protein CAPTEDRAFT_166924 [Capitella teleta]|uniref:Vacuolar protein sorting-associated protein 72 homolog n=1 Tax=Capitella teleta TaxID=283909 RepID=R7UBY1_CAPTE|nr:hypothetical protein CAPTEDRAFT_166924 [Capitella teleta]|eukprot:ELU03616.1 hypothetical protein CAPTEDRAFT_166924 [Capitella teleta]